MKLIYPIAALLTAVHCITATGCYDPVANPSTSFSNGIENTDAPEKAVVIFISPDADKSRTEAVKQAFFDGLKTAEAGTRWHVMWARDHRHLVSFDVPHATGQRRFRELQKVLPIVHSAFGEVKRDATGQVDLPDIAAAVNKQLTTETECNVAIYGTPRYLNEEQDAFQHNLVFVTKGGSVGHELSPFQTDIKLPKNCRVTWIAPQTNYGHDSKHEAAIRHFNGYYIQELGGRLLRTTDDISLLLDFRAPKNFTQLVKLHDSPGKYPATIKTVGNGDDEIQTVEFNQEDFPVPGTGVNDSPESVLSAAEADDNTIALAIHWSSDDPSCDIDMWLSSNGQPMELSHSRKETLWGRLYRDVVSSSTTTANEEEFENWEWVKVDHARLHDLVLYLNVYRTTAPARVTIVRVWKGKRRSRVIDLNVVKGDGGRNRNNRAASEAWRRISLYSTTDGGE